MRTAVHALLVLLVAGTAPICLAQRDGVTELQDDAAASKLRALSARLTYRDIDPADKERYLTLLPEITRRIHSVVDEYIRDARRLQSSESIQARVRTLLSDHHQNPEYGDLAFAREADLAAGRSLVLAYTIVRPPHFDVGTIRGYRVENGHFDLVATTGDDFEDCNMFKAEVPSRRAGELWLLVWGARHTFNGRKIRFRLYTFDGASFQTIWAPEDMFSAEVRLTPAGFSIDHHVSEPPYELTDEYVLTQDGVIKID